MQVEDWLFLLEQYAVACENDRLVVHPVTVLRWIEAVKDDHGYD
jgi:hypothetical protein